MSQGARLFTCGLDVGLGLRFDSSPVCTHINLVADGIFKRVFLCSHMTEILVHSWIAP